MSPSPQTAMFPAPVPVPYAIGVLGKEEAEALGCKEGDEYAVFEGGREARAFVCDLMRGKPVGVSAELLEACKMALNGMNALLPELKSGTDSCTIAALNIDRLNHAIAKAESVLPPC